MQRLTWHLDGPLEPVKASPDSDCERGLDTQNYLRKSVPLLTINIFTSRLCFRRHSSLLITCENQAVYSSQVFYVLNTVISLIYIKEKLILEAL